MANSDQTKEYYNIHLKGEDLRLHFSAILADIQSTKKQQLEITNYSVGSMVAIIYFLNLIYKEGEVKFYVNIVLFILSTFILVGGIYLLCKLQTDLGISRKRKDRAIELFPAGVNYILYGREKNISRKERQPQGIVGVFIAALIIGWILVTYFVLWRFILCW
jgi:hypothetical protein